MTSKKKRQRGDSLVKKAWEHIAGGEGYEAREVLHKLFDRYAERADRETTLLFAWSFEVDGRIYKSENWTRSILEKHPDYIEAWELLAHLLAEQEDRLDELKETVEHAIEVGADPFSMKRRLGHGYSFNDKYDDAIRIFLKVAQEKPEDPLSWDNLEHVQCFGKQYGDSLASRRMKLDLKPDDERAQHWIGMAQGAINAREKRVGTIGEG
ncbi:MAG: hypothetical protein ACFFEX_18240 [Candidatus Thorarchaeota archaeon]